MQTGTVKKINESKGFGFIKVKGTGQEVFDNVHLSDSQEQSYQNHEFFFNIQEGEKNNLLELNEKLKDLYQHGNSVFEDSKKFERWLNKPNGALNGEIPANLIETKEGIRQVDKILGRIEHGIFS